jgi:ATP-dependent helicase HepA
MSNSESELGLGIVLDTDHRTVTIAFPATGDTRVYAKQTAPLSRITFEAGDTIKSHEGWSLQVNSVSEQDHLLVYQGTTEAGKEQLLLESQLDHAMQLNRPAERLFGGQIDSGKWFELRYQTLKHINRLAHSELRGLTGCRTSLIPHQLYIAHEVANRYAPRVLLADEVGLGKTIEAGMIIHQQVLTGRAQRIIIVVPETLVHQWLVEMMRRFNLFFSIFDEERCLAIEEAGNLDNPFQSEQLILCNLEFLTHNPKRQEQAMAGEWDLLVVDEAHHLRWSPGHASREYQVIEMLAAETSGVLLLTATPEQLGKESHFARLRLLDPDRFHSFEAFIKEEASYSPFANAVEELLESDTLSSESKAIITDTFGETDNKALLDHCSDSSLSQQERDNARAELVEHLLDRHGTGRILFRNTRSSIKAFPGRQVIPYPLPLPDTYTDCIRNISIDQINPREYLCPESLYQHSCFGQAAFQRHWTKFDPRVDWLIDKLKTLRPGKVLVIAAYANTALDLAEALRVKEGIHAAVFHEGLSIIERDRAAAFFADQDYGSQVMVCSEIGSEGRNFQFSHHLVLFDLPLNPDLLEQRIGRLDRIGQTKDIQIHVPYFQHSAMETMFRWYHEALSAFETTCPAGLSVFSKLEAELIEVLTNPGTTSDSLDSLIKRSSHLYQEMNQALQQGRDKLLEYNSCRLTIANALKAQAEKEDVENLLGDYLPEVFDCYGVDFEDHSQSCYIIRPSDHMQTESFPGLLPDGMTITFDRATALTFEDAHYITWDHPLVTGAMDLVTSNEYGNTAVTAMKSDRFKAGTLLVECVYMIESASTTRLQSSRYFPPTAIRLLLDKAGNNFSDLVSHGIINQSKIAVDKDTASRVVRDQMNELKNMLETSEKHAEQISLDVIKTAHRNGRSILDKEISRLKALSKVNPNVRKEELEYYEEHFRALDRIFDSARPRLDALRIIVCV